MNKSSPDRLFVPLATAPFEWFQSGHKRWELRRYGRQYTEKHVRPGRSVELRRGYSDATNALWGTVVRTVKAESLQQLFQQVPFDSVIPPAHNQAEAISMCASILRISESEPVNLLAFEVTLRPTIIQIAPTFIEPILTGDKKTTIRLGARNYRLGPATLHSESQDINVRITGIRVAALSSLTENDAISDGFLSLESLRHRLRDFYPDISDESVITIVEFCRL